MTKLIIVLVFVLASSTFSNGLTCYKCRVFGQYTNCPLKVVDVEICPPENSICVEITRNNTVIKDTTTPEKLVEKSKSLESVLYNCESNGKELRGCDRRYAFFEHSEIIRENKIKTDGLGVCCEADLCEVFNSQPCITHSKLISLIFAILPLILI